MMFPDNLKNKIEPAQALTQEILDFRPSVDALKHAEASLDEASRCFDRAMALAPKEPDVFFQRAGYMSESNWQSCFFRHYRDNEELDASQGFVSFCSPETIANLEKAAELDPKNYDYISLAAYFTWMGAFIQAKTHDDFTIDKMPDESR